MKIKYKKIRGKNRRLRAIKKWVKQNEQLNLNYLKDYQREYVKFWVAPWSNLNIGNSIYPQPQGIFRERFLTGLAHIYRYWKCQLDSLNQPYYLKIWLFENELSRSQVVCAIGENLHFYDNTFQKVEQNFSPLQALNLTQNEQDLFADFTWQQTLELQAVYNDHVGNPQDYLSYNDYLRDKAWFESLEETALEKVYDNSPNSPYAYYYLIANDTVWLGELT